MTGGNIKALLPELCRLSRPTVIEGNAYTLRVPGSCLISQVTFECEGYPLLVILLARDESQAQQQ